MIAYMNQYCLLSLQGSLAEYLEFGAPVQEDSSLSTVGHPMMEVIQTVLAEQPLC